MMHGRRYIIWCGTCGITSANTSLHACRIGFLSFSTEGDARRCIVSDTLVCSAMFGVSSAGTASAGDTLHACCVCLSEVQYEVAPDDARRAMHHFTSQRCHQLRYKRRRPDIVPSNI